MKFPATLFVILSGVFVSSAQTVPLPPDPHELVTGSVQMPTTPADRAAALSLLERARQNADMHMPGTPPFNVKISFNAGGNVPFTGPGTISEVWLSGRHWRYDQNLANYSEIRVGSMGHISTKRTGAIPMRVAMLRAAMFWPVGGNPSSGVLRTANVQLNGRPVTCLLLFGGAEAATPGRNWEESEYCVDNASGLLQIYSRAPGNYVVYGYNSKVQFHGRQVPDQITIFVGGASVLEGKVTIEDLASGDPTLAAEVPEMVTTSANNMGVRFAMQARSAAAGSTVKPVIVNASIDTQGKVVEAEVAAASDPALGYSALDLVKGTNFGTLPTWRQAYINVRFAAAP